MMGQRYDKFCWSISINNVLLINILEKHANNKKRCTFACRFVRYGRRHNEFNNNSLKKKLKK